MTDYRQAFLGAIQDEPENEHHRQVYADWLDEQGEYDEAERQRRYLPALRWLRAFAQEHEARRTNKEGEPWAFYSGFPNDFRYEDDDEVVDGGPRRGKARGTPTAI
jgi:uncharacterized protein (TIGR02996 family)